MDLDILEEMFTFDDLNISAGGLVLIGITWIVILILFGGLFLPLFDNINNVTPQIAEMVIATFGVILAGIGLYIGMNSIGATIWTFVVLIVTFFFIKPIVSWVIIGLISLILLFTIYDSY